MYTTFVIYLQVFAKITNIFLRKFGIAELEVEIFPC